ncbi:LPXTG cell wall anchor domain-containing protein, partial [Enterococcus faecalis]
TEQTVTYVYERKMLLITEQSIKKITQQPSLKNYKFVLPPYTDKNRGSYPKTGEKKETIFIILGSSMITIALTIVILGKIKDRKYK